MHQRYFSNGDKPKDFISSSILSFISIDIRYKLYLLTMPLLNATYK